MENHNLLLKLSRLFPSSFTSCQARTRPDVVVADSSITISKSKKNVSPLSRKHPKPENNSRRPPDAKGRKCPPGVRNHPSSSSQSGRWFTSSDEVRARGAAAPFDTDTFYSMSSNSGDSFRARRRQSTTTMKSIDEKSKYFDQESTRVYYDDIGRRNRRRRRVHRKSSRGGGGMEEGVAVEKKSRDPYGDFMGSMVEMIVEKQMFGEKDLERLLSCYLALNNKEYHGIIFKVFHDICQTLFFNN